ncbi:ABC transporter substrate-binding protein [Streptomyces alkaliterrae]
MQRRRFMGLAALGMVSAIGLSAAGCGNDSKAGGDVTLKVVVADYGTPGSANSSKGYWDDLVRAFEADGRHGGVKVDVTVLSWEEVDDKVAEMVKAGEAPDIAQIGAYADYAASDKLYSASELLSIPVHADIIPALAQAGELGRVQYGLPFVSSTRLLFYNKTLFTEAGLDPAKPPKSWDELQSAAEALRTAGVKHPYGLPLGPEEAQAESMMWMLSGGGGYTDNVNTYTLDSNENVKTFTWLRDEFVGKGLTGPDSPGKTNRRQLFEAFAKGEVGMLNGHPTLMQQAAKGKVDFGTAPLPGREGEAGATMGVADWIMGFKQNGNREQIGAFLDFVFSTEQHYSFTDRYDLLPVTTSASEKMLDDKKHKDLWPFLEQLGAAEFYPVSKVSWAATSAEVKKSIGRAVEKGTDPQAVLTSLQRRAETEEAAARARR